MIIAIDPGSEQSAYVEYYKDGRVHSFGKRPNEELINWDVLRYSGKLSNSFLAIEMIASYGMPVGASVFDTCVWIGRFIQAWNGPYELVYRRDVKLHLCGQARAKDGNVRQAIIDRFGGKEKAIGRKASPGPLYGVSGDTWQALAVAITYSDNHARKEAA